MKDFKNLTVWEKSHQFTLRIYEITRAFPPDERFGLSAQLRRAAASIPTNIAEGCGRNTERELARFLSIASGSASEAEYQLLLARDIGYINNETYEALEEQVKEIRKMLYGFINKLM